MVNMSAKFDKETCNGVVSIVFTRSMHGQTDGTTVALLYPHRNALRGDNEVCNIKVNTNVVKCLGIFMDPLIMVNMCAKFDKETCNGVVSIVFTSLFPCMSIVTLTFNLWPQNSIGIILSSC